jgi:hypothetical protein
VKYRHLSFEQRLHNAIGAQQVEDYKGRHAYLHGVTYNREEFDVFWLKSKNSTWGHGFGRMVGFEEIYLNCVQHTDRMTTENKLAAMLTYPQLQGHDLRSVTASGCHALASDVIEVAEDGMSARSFYLTPGTLMGSVGMESTDSRGATWFWERYGSDFVYFEGKWQWFHEQVCPDLMSTYDVGNWAYDDFCEKLSGNVKAPPAMPPEPGDGPPPSEMVMGPAFLSEPGAPHKENSILQTVQNTCLPPEPYKTLDDDNTYSLGRNDPSGKITREPGPPVVHKHHKF